MSDNVLRKLARDQWVRLHGTPRVSVLVGEAHARELWSRWLALAECEGTLLDGAFDTAIREAIAQATATPRRPIGVIVAPALFAAWRDSARADRTVALV